MRGAHPTLVHRFPLGMVALSSRQCSFLATYLVRSIYDGRWCEEKPSARKRASALPGYKETEEDSLPKRQCHRVALSSRQCSFLATYLARSIYVGRWCEEKPSARKRASALPGYKGTEEDSLPKRQCHRVALSSRQCSFLATYLARSIYDGRWCEEKPSARKRASALPGYKGTEEDSLPKRQCHRVALSSRQCSFLATYLARFTLDDGAKRNHLRGNVPRRSQATRERKKIHCRNGSATGWHCRPDSVLSWRRTLLVRFTLDVGAKRNRLRGNVPRRSQAARKRKKIHCRNGSATGWHCRPDSVLPWRRTLLVRFTMDVGAKRALVRGIGLRRSQATRKRKKIHCRNGSATGWHCRPDSVLSWRRTLLVRFTMDDGSKRALVRGIGPRRSQATRERKKIHCRNVSATGWHCRPDSVLSWRRTLLVRFTMDVGSKRDRTAWRRTSALPGYKGTEEDSLPKRQCHPVALSSRQCYSLATYLARSIYDGRRFEAGSGAWNRTSALPGYKGTEEDSLPKRQCHRVALSSRQCSFLATYLARSIYVGRWCEEKPSARKRASALPGYKGTEEDSLPKRQCHRVPLSSRQCSFLATYLARSIYDGRWCEEKPSARKRASSLPGCKETEEDSLPKRQCHRVALSSRQCSLLASYLARSIYDGRRFEAGSGAWNRTSALPGYKETEEDSLPKRQCHPVALSSRQCSSLATYLGRSIYVGRWCEEKPSARKRASALPGYKGTEEDSLPKRQCHRVALSSRQCSFLATYLVRSIYDGRRGEEKPSARKRASALPGCKGTEEDSLPKRQCHRVALSSRQCSFLASYLARSIYVGRWCEAG